MNNVLLEGKDVAEATVCAWAPRAKEALDIDADVNGRVAEGGVNKTASCHHQLLGP